MKFTGLEKNQFRIKVTVDKQTYTFLADEVKDIKLEFERYDRVTRTWKDIK